MTKKSVMLGEISARELHGPWSDFMDKLQGEDGREWFKEFKRFLRKESCWVKDGLIYTRSISDGYELILPPNNGMPIIPLESDVFAFIDADFEDRSLDMSNTAIVETSVIVREMIEDGDFRKIFGELGDRSSLCLTQSQIIDFVCLYKVWLRTDGYVTFFLFQKAGVFFVAGVHIDVGGGVNLIVDQYLDDRVWPASERHRLVIPQLTL